MSGLGLFGMIYLFLFGWLGYGAAPEPIRAPQDAENQKFHECMSQPERDVKACERAHPGLAPPAGAAPEANASGEPVDVIIN